MKIQSVIYSKEAPNLGSGTMWLKPLSSNKVVAHIFDGGWKEIVAESPNYNVLYNKPKINNVELKGNLSLDDLGIIGKDSLDDIIKEINTDIEDKLVEKADLDANKKYIKDTQLNPLSGYQTGAVMGKGSFSKDSANLKTLKSCTVVSIVVTGDDVTTDQCICQQSSRILQRVINNSIGECYLNRFTVKANSLYEVVSVFEEDTNTLKSYVNGVLAHSKEMSSVPPSERVFHVGITTWQTAPFLGKILSVRMFDFAMTNEQLEEAWNNGHPELWRVPDEFRAHEIVWPIDNVAESQNVFLGNNPSQITTTQNVPQENGFSGAFQRFAGASQAPSVYCNLWIYKYNRAPIRLTIEYRSTSDLYSDTALTKLLLPANTGDAKTVTLDVIDGVYGGVIYAKTTDDTFEIRTIKAEEIGCILDLNAHGLLPTVWRDTSGHGNDLPYSPSSGNPDTCELSYERHGFEEVIIGTAAPTVTPDFIGQKFIDTTNKVTYTAYGTTNSGDWK